LEWRDIPLHITGNEGEIAVHWDLKKNAGKKNILQEGFPPPRPHLSQYVQPMGRARESSPAGNTK
jgi:competence protein ComEC